jgi:hypothetical protein
MYKRCFSLKSGAAARSHPPEILHPEQEERQRPPVFPDRRERHPV